MMQIKLGHRYRWLVTGVVGIVRKLDGERVLLDDGGFPFWVRVRDLEALED